MTMKNAGDTEFKTIILALSATIFNGVKAIQYWNYRHHIYHSYKTNKKKRKENILVVCTVHIAGWNKYNAACDLKRCLLGARNWKKKKNTS